MNNEKYLNKIKKLLNLARKSTNPNEAAAAIRQAQNLMREHKLSESDVELIDINEASSKGAPSDAINPPKYFGYLAEIVCRAFGVKSYLTWRYSHLRGVPKRIVSFYGPETRPQIAAYAFDVMSRQMTAARKAFIGEMRKGIKTSTKTARADTFCENWATGAYTVLEDFAVKESEATLMAAYDDRMRKQGGVETASLRESGKCRGKDEAAIAGFYAGVRAKIHHAVDGSEAVRIGSAS